LATAFGFLLIRKNIDPEEQIRQARARDQRVGNGKELKVEFMNYLYDNESEMLECNVAKFLHDKGYKVIWTPPYCPGLQPIELLWLAEKNHVAMHFFLCGTERNGDSHERGFW
jgi:hypothetical protein